MNRHQVRRCLLLAAVVFAHAPPVYAVQIVNFDALDLALSNGATVTSWDGQTANATPTYLTNQTPNGRPAVEFNGTDHFGTKFLSPSAANDFIIAAVLKPTNTGGYHNLIDDDPSVRPMLWIDNNYRYELNLGGSGTRSASSGWDIVIADSKNTTLYVNSPTPTGGGGTATAFTTAKFFDFFNRDGGSSYQGLVAEFRVYNDAADFGSFAALYGELDAKWFQQSLVPEPNTLLLVGVATLGCLVRHRRQPRNRGRRWRGIRAQ